MQRVEAASTAPIRRVLGRDLAVYLGFAVFAFATAMAAGMYPHGLWGAYATAGYLLAACGTVVVLLRSRGSRWVPVVAAFLVAMVAPLIHLVVRRLGGGDWAHAQSAWSAQPEVWVIERSAKLLLDTGSPYVDVTALGRPPVVNDYTPYGPVMAVFGLPRALVGELGLDGSPLAQALTDARVVFIAVATGCVVLALRVLGRATSVPVGAAQLALVCPATALTWAVAGPDLAILGLLVLSLVLTVRGRYWWAAVLLALVVSAKLTAAPAVLVLVILVFARSGFRQSAVFLGTLVVTALAVNLPVLLATPAAYVEHVIAFPAGAGMASSPAASPLPGHLISSTGPAGHAIALVLLGLAALAITVWLVVRPPVTGADAALRIAVGLGTATLLTPATRWGYLVYPLVLLGTSLCLRDNAESESAAPDGATSSSG